MVTQDEKLCAPANKLTDLIDLGLEFVAGVKEQVVLAKEVGLDTTDIDKLLKQTTTKFKATRKALRI